MIFQVLVHWDSLSLQYVIYHLSAGIHENQIQATVTYGSTDVIDDMNIFTVTFS